MQDGETICHTAQDPLFCLSDSDEENLELQVNRTTVSYAETIYGIHDIAPQFRLDADGGSQPLRCATATIH